MGLIKAALSAASSVMADQWKEYFYCDSLSERVLVVKGQKKTTSRSSNKGADNIISNGSVIAVADGQCMIIVDQGKVAEICAEAGEFVYDASTEPSIFSGNLGASLLQSFQTLGRRFTFGGEIPKEQRVYYINTKELIGNKYGTPNPVPFRMVDPDINLRMTISIRCFGEYSYRICDPILFYKNVVGNTAETFTRDKLDSQLKTELMTALQPAFARISEQGIGYAALPGHTMEIADALNDVLSKKWRELRGLEIVSFGVSSVSASEEDEKKLKQMQEAAFLSNANMAAGHMASATAAAMQAAASNTATGPMMAFAGMNMASGVTGMNAQNLFQTAAQQQAAAPAAPANSWKCSCGATATGKFCPECGAKKPEPKPAGDSWKCSCGATVTGKFCPECGTKKPAEEAGWTCTCGSVNKGKFCPECGAKKPASEPLYKCDKCGWEPADPKHPPKFCPECGDIFDDGDIQ